MNGSSVCVLPWIHFSTRTNGEMRLCCEYRGTVGHRVNTTDFVSEFEGAPFGNLREQMLNGELPAGCASCARQESLGAQSKRQRENAVWSKRLGLDEASLPAELAKVKPAIRYVDLRLSNRCNSVCQTCISLSSSDILKRNQEIRARGGELPAYHDQPDAEALKIDDWSSDPKFWERFDKLIPSLESIYLTGGEPMLNSKLPEFLERCGKDIDVRLNTNVTVINESLLEALAKFRAVNLALSVDALGPLNEYIRPPFTWKTIEAKMERYLALPAPFLLTLSPTISLFNILHLPEYILSYLKLWRRFPKLELYLNILTEPDYQSVNLLNQNSKEKVERELLWLASSLPQIPMRERLQEQIAAVTSEMDTNLGTRDQRRMEFYKYVRAVASRTQKNLEEIFPELFEGTN